MKRIWKKARNALGFDRTNHLLPGNSGEEAARQWGFFAETFAGRPRVLMTAGHGYGNVGDEAQCGACLDRWKRVAPGCRITVLSPNPAYTEALHCERVDWAVRVAWFRANTMGPYFNEGRWFRRFFFFLRWRLELSCCFIRAGIPFALLRPREMQIVHQILQHDVVHISGGGFLTGKTRSRLWDNCLLMRVCHLLGKPCVLTGHNIGVFQDQADRKVARMGLRSVQRIGLRDKGISERAINEIGIQGDHVTSTCDDALLCPRMANPELRGYLEQAGANPDIPWIAVQFHEWGQKKGQLEAIAKRFAEICDGIVEAHGLRLIFISMTPSDVEPEKGIISRMQQGAILAPYSPDYRVVRGIIAEAQLVFTMKHHPIVFAQGEGVPVVSVALDDYYVLKNRGALDNTGHGEYMVDIATFETKRPLSLIAQALQKREEIRSEMLGWVESMRTIELDVYREVVDGKIG